MGFKSLWAGGCSWLAMGGVVVARGWPWFCSLQAAMSLRFGGHGFAGAWVAVGLWVAKGGRGLNWCFLGWVESHELVVSESVESVEPVVAGLDSMVVGLATMVGFGGCWVGLGGGLSWWSF